MPLSGGAVPVRSLTFDGVGRTVTLVIATATATATATADDRLDALPPFDVPQPWWQEVASVVAGARDRYGVEVQVLRLLHGDRPAPPGGHVTYLAETPAEVMPLPGATPVAIDRSPQPCRAPWAVPGGPAASVAWALAALDTPGAVAVQQRSWNLSAVWRLDVGGSPVAWLKQVPAFFAHEAAVLRLVEEVAPGLTPRLLAAGPDGRMLLSAAPGEECYGASAAVRQQIAADLHPVQEGFAGRVDDLLAAGVPDRRSILRRVREVAEPYLGSIPGLAQVVAELPGRLAAIDACGLPDTLVHGDLHPGNVIADGTGRVLIDWGDAVVGNPAYDIVRLVEDLPAAQGVPVIGRWAERWRRSAPGSDPERALALIGPVVELRLATVYADFLANIEPSERPYHAADVPERLAAAVAASAVPPVGIP